MEEEKGEREAQAGMDLMFMYGRLIPADGQVDDMHQIVSYQTQSIPAKGQAGRSMET